MDILLVGDDSVDDKSAQRFDVAVDGTPGAATIMSPGF